MQDFFSNGGGNNKYESFAAGTNRGYFESSRTIDYSINDSFRNTSRTFTYWYTGRKPLCEQAFKKCNEIEE